ncbi:MAG: HEAT repeat domain-containing protein [Ilumatobacteraceae bacterium]|jgi:HEAT repeat protein|nr:HEAT repeat domain-containing protein [Ilumatobacteraceae bacterium]MDP5108183.1 HEAT repeat domain-containing protein [Ilumatobacteraceae bacterium]
MQAHEVLLASHKGNAELLCTAFAHDNHHIRSLALHGLLKNNVLTDEQVRSAEVDPSRLVRHRLAQLGAVEPRINLSILLHDVDFAVAETAAWSLGERVDVTPDEFALLLEGGAHHDHAIVRESCIAALGAIGNPRAVPVILEGCNDKPAVRRRAILALAPFDGPEVTAALEKALLDRDWQVRQAAEDLLAIEKEL